LLIRCLYKTSVLSRIEEKSGVIIYEPIPESHDVLNKDIAFAIIKLEGVTEGGSGNRLELKAEVMDTRNYRISI
jgi:hypothetical protein